MKKHVPTKVNPQLMLSWAGKILPLVIPDLKEMVIQKYKLPRQILEDVNVQFEEFDIHRRCIVVSIPLSLPSGNKKNSPHE